MTTPDICQFNLACNNYDKKYAKIANSGQNGPKIRVLPAKKYTGSKKVHHRRMWRLRLISAMFMIAMVAVVVFAFMVIFSPKSDGDDATGCDDRVEGGAVGGGGGNQGGIDKTVLPRPPALHNLQCAPQSALHSQHCTPCSAPLHNIPQSAVHSPCTV